MPIIKLDADAIASLLEKSEKAARSPKKVEERKAPREPTPEEIANQEELVRSGNAWAKFGPLRTYDTTEPCVHTSVKGGRRYNCGSPTPFKLKGIRTCSIHVMREMNLMLVDLGVE